jgi:hypothetical protein
MLLDSHDAVLCLYSEEIRDGSGHRAWAWTVFTARMLPPRYGVTYGGNVDKEVARAQADAAARAFGYELMETTDAR